MHAALSWTITCRSPDPSGPPSIFASRGIGYGPRSLSPAYAKPTVTLACPARTVVTGMPIGAPSHSPEPKSGCMVAPAPMLSTNAADFGCTGRPDTSARQTLSAGIPAQLAGFLVVGDAFGDGPVPSPPTPVGWGVTPAGGVACANVGLPVAPSPHAARPAVRTRQTSTAGVRRTRASCYPRSASSTPVSRSPRNTGSRPLTAS